MGANVNEEICFIQTDENWFNLDNSLRGDNNKERRHMVIGRKFVWMQSWYQEAWMTFVVLNELAFAGQCQTPEHDIWRPIYDQSQHNKVFSA